MTTPYDAPEMTQTVWQTAEAIHQIITTCTQNKWPNATTRKYGGTLNDHMVIWYDTTINCSPEAGGRIDQTTDYTRKITIIRTRLAAAQNNLQLDAYYSDPITDHRHPNWPSHWASDIADPNLQHSLQTWINALPGDDTTLAHPRMLPSAHITTFHDNPDPTVLTATVTVLPPWNRGAAEHSNPITWT